MTSVWQAPAIAVVIAWLTAPPASLGQAGRQEALRRILAGKAVLSLSLYDWPSPAATENRASVPAPPAQPTTAANPAAADEPRHDEAWWRTRMSAARAALARDQTLADAMQSHINSLRADAASRDDPAQQAALRQRLNAAIAELDRLTQQIAADRQAIVSIEDDARRLGVPAGWIRDEGTVSASGRSP
jgi:hypothetical protein